MRDPVGHNMVGVPWYKHSHIHSTLDSVLQCVQQHVIGDEVSSGEQNRLLCLIDCRNVHIANRKRHTHSFILADGNESIELVVIPLRDLLVCWTEAIPETDECSPEFRCSCAAQSQMCVTQ